MAARMPADGQGVRCSPKGGVSCRLSTSGLTALHTDSPRRLSVTWPQGTRGREPPPTREGNTRGLLGREGLAATLRSGQTGSQRTLQRPRLARGEQDEPVTLRSLNEPSGRAHSIQDPPASSVNTGEPMASAPLRKRRKNRQQWFPYP